MLTGVSQTLRNVEAAQATCHRAGQVAACGGRGVEGRAAAGRPRASENRGRQHQATPKRISKVNTTEQRPSSQTIQCHLALPHSERLSLRACRRYAVGKGLEAAQRHGPGGKGIRSAFRFRALCFPVSPPPRIIFPSIFR